MSSLQTIRANQFLFLASRFLAEDSPWECMQAAKAACCLDRNLQNRARELLRKATELPLDLQPAATDDLDRLRQYARKLEMALEGDRGIREAGPQAPLKLDSSEVKPDELSSSALRAELQQVFRFLEKKEGWRFERARAIIRSLLVRFPFQQEEDRAAAEEETDDDDDYSFFREEETYHNLGNRLYQVGHFEEALELYSLALHLNPELVESFFNRGLANTRLGRYEKAEEDLNKVIGINGNLAEAYYTRGLVHEYKLEFASAVADYNRALEVDPKYIKAEHQRRIAEGKKTSGKEEPKGKNSEETEGIVKDWKEYEVKPTCRLSHVGDHGAIKFQLRKILAYLAGGSLLEEWGAELPRGVLLQGEPGVGKTHLARALAGEAQVPFFAPPLSLLFDMYVGNSEKNMRNLFQAAARYPNAILFFDELDVLASNRREARQAQEPWAARMAACFLEEFDNIASRNRGVVVFGATNAIEAIDPAFLRPGRFTYIIEVRRPGELGMADIFLVCLQAANERGKREDFLDPVLQQAVLSPRQEWLQKAHRHDETGMMEVARLAVGKEMVGDDVREIIRRVIDEKIAAGMDRIDLGPITVSDLHRHVQEYEVVRKASF